jgi:hypothetical protein
MEVATLEIAEELYSTPHELVHWHEGGLLGCTKPVDQLVANVGEPHECLEIISLAFDEVFERLALIIQATCRDDVQPFDQADLLEALLQEQEQRRPVSLLICRQVQNNLQLEIRKHLCKEELGVEASLVGCNTS